MQESQKGEKDDEWVYPLQCHSYLTRGLVYLLSSPHSPPHVQRNALLVLERLPLEYRFPNTIACLDPLMRALRPFMMEKNPNAPSATAAMKRLRKNAEIRQHRLCAAEGLLLEALLEEGGRVDSVASTPDTAARKAVFTDGKKETEAEGRSRGKPPTGVAPDAFLPSMGKEKAFSVERLRAWLTHTRRREAFARQALGLSESSSSSEQEEEWLTRDAQEDVADDDDMRMSDAEKEEEEEEETAKTADTEDEGSRPFDSPNEEVEKEVDDIALEEEEGTILSSISSSSSSSSFSSARDEEEKVSPVSNTDQDRSVSSEGEEKEECMKEEEEQQQSLPQTPPCENAV